MGYLLPIQSIQLQQYANRTMNVSNSFAYIGKVQPIQLNSNVITEIKEQDRSRKNKRERYSIDSPSYLYSGATLPNPANLSASVEHFVGKGLLINTYV